MSNLVIAPFQAVHIVVQLRVTVTASAELALAVVKSLLDTMEVVVFVSDVTAQLVAMIGLAVDFVV